MKRLLMLAVLSGGAVLAQSAPPVPPYSPASCQVQARYTAYRSAFGQRLLEISLPAICPLNAGRLARIITTNGGKLPPVGYFRLGAGFPRKWTYWVLGKVTVQDRYAPNDWRDIPLKETR